MEIPKTTNGLPENAYRELKEVKNIFQFFIPDKFILK
jgi:hypothetical protein